jgi:DNA integrity scanning protein DisA with diadenylate cyclase activity
MRHRAAIGITEQTDAISVIVSEETGNISVAIDGKIQANISPDELERILTKETD